MPVATYDDSVFINCPFDGEYRSLFDAIVFAVQDCGCFPRCALEVSDSSLVRIEKIFKMISQCKFGIHDISFTDLYGQHQLPRFNMPLELGMFMGAKRFGSHNQKRKLCLVLDRDQFRYQMFCSDIAGQDISAHKRDPENAIRLVRNWLNDSLFDVKIPGGSKIVERYHSFENDLPIYCSASKKIPGELTFIEFRNLVLEWLNQNPW